MPRFASRRRSIGARIALVPAAALALAAALVVAPLAAANPASALTPLTGTSVTSSTITPMETYDWAEVYFGNGEIAQGQTLQVTVSDLRTGRVITATLGDSATLGDGAIVVPDIPAADRYGDTGFAVAIPADFPAGVHNLTIGTDEFAPIVIPITVTPGTGTPTEPAPIVTTQPTAQPTAPGAGSETPGSVTPGAPRASPFDPPVPITVVYGILGGIVGVMIITAVVRRTRKARP